MKPVDLFTRDVHSFWATCYQLDLKLFDQFLLRRLGNAPLNAVVLCDEDSVSEALGGLSDIDRHVAANANRRYLVRGVRAQSGGRFHPKTYLFASRRGVHLLVGSGNLTRTGLDRGRETFVLYNADKPDELPVIRAWASWMRGLVGAQNDAILSARFEHLLSTVPVLLGPGDGGEFATNESESILEHLLRRAPRDVAELHVIAPFFDEHARALAELVAALAPTRALHLYLGARTSVDGPSLKKVLSSAGCMVVVHGFRPSEFVHAKLIGLVSSDGTGLLVCGSANISQAALTRAQSALAPSANTEAVVFRVGSQAEVQTAFLPPEHELVDLSLEGVAQLEYEDEDSALAGWPVRLRRAAVTDGGHIRVHAEGAIVGLSLSWDGTTEALALTIDCQTEKPVPADSDPLVVWLVDAADTQCSNPVVLDDPYALEAALGESEGQRDRPEELRDEDGASDLVRLLTWAHRRFIFDVDDTPALRRAANAQDHQADADDTGFWERYAKEELTADPRSHSYRPLGTTGALTEVDLLLREIESMLKAARRDRRLRLVRAPQEDDEPAAEAGTGHPWSFSARERLRARNLLRRWARALADPRHAWIAPSAPSRNYEVLLEVLALTWLGDALDAEVVAELLGEVWIGLLGANGQRGLLDRAEPELVQEVLGSLTDEARELASGLAYSALYRDLPWTRWIYDWQPFLVRGIELRVFSGGPFACDLVEALWGTRPTEAELEDRLLERAQWTDDQTWGQRMAEELGTGAIRFVPQAGFKGVNTVLRVEGLPDPSHDPRLIVLARRTMAFKRSDHVLIQAGDERFLLRLGRVCRARIGEESRSSIVPIDTERLAAIERQHGTLAHLLGLEAAA